MIIILSLVERLIVFFYEFKWPFRHFDGHMLFCSFEYSLLFTLVAYPNWPYAYITHKRLLSSLVFWRVSFSKNAYVYYYIVMYLLVCKAYRVHCQIQSEDNTSFKFCLIATISLWWNQPRSVCGTFLNGCCQKNMNMVSFVQHL